MKKIIILLILAILLVGGVWYARRDRLPITPRPSTNTTTSTHTNAQSGISFTYPKILTVTDTQGTTTVHHEVVFTHHDYCDFKGEIDTTIPTLTDFHLIMHVANTPLIETMNALSPYIPEENFVDGQVVPSPGFIDPVTYGSLSGFAIFEGAEGCGHTVYYFPVTPAKTLVITQEFVTVFSGSIALDEKDRAEVIPGVINKARETEIVQGILGNLRVQ